MSRELVPAQLTLDQIASDIHEVWAESRAHQVAAWDGYFRVGRLIGEARSRFSADQDYGRWFAAQGFGFSSEWGRRLARVADNEHEVRGLLATAVGGNDPGVNAVLTQLRQSEARDRVPRAVEGDVPLPDRKYRAIVIDPPWPMQKIEREQRPDQGVALDYPVMSLGAIAGLPVRDLAADDGCHVYLWTTQRFLPDALDLFETWGVTYQCVMTWVKNVGITPFSWMYDTEHVLFGRVGSLQLERLGLRLSFSAAVAGHSVKPDVFYERVLQASPAPRLDMFARRPREGFDVWGNEVA